MVSETRLNAPEGASPKSPSHPVCEGLFLSTQHKEASGCRQSIS
jgi:hypothetical protein